MKTSKSEKNQELTTFGRQEWEEYIKHKPCIFVCEITKFFSKQKLTCRFDDSWLNRKLTCRLAESWLNRKQTCRFDDSWLNRKRTCKLAYEKAYL